MTTLYELIDDANELKRLRAAVQKHHAQKADDRCWQDDDELYRAFGLPPADIRVGDKAAMLANCQRFVEARCAGGAWKSYAELEAENAQLRRQIEGLCERIAAQSELLSRRAEK